MMLLTTDEARVVSAVLEFGTPVLAVATDADQSHYLRAREKLAAHTQALVLSMLLVRGTSGREPAA